MTNVIISGAGGQLGNAVRACLTFQEDFNVFTFDRGQLDITDRDKLSGILSTLPKTQFWINCAAYTKVDDAERDPETAHHINCIGPRCIADACREAGVHLFDFSSDYVYHNDLRRPLLETDPIEPKGVYARSKRDGELAIAASGVSFTIVRTSWVYGPGGHNFVNTMLRLGKNKTSLRIVSDQIGAPTFTLDIADAIKQLIHLDLNGGRNEIKGIFNFANAGSVTWDNFARTIFKYASIPCSVESITSEEYGAPAPRPSYSLLDCTKISRLLEKPIPGWEDALQRYLQTGFNV